MVRFLPLSTRASTAYAELFETVRSLELSRAVDALSGGFSSKTVKNKGYWYYQFRDVDDSVRQIYVGPDDERTRALVARQRDQTMAEQTEAMARAAIELGCEPIVPQHFQIIRRMAEYGFFRAGGVLVGTHAFAALSSALGVRWNDGSRTEDVDFAHPGKNLAIALPADLVVDVPAAIESLELGFIPTSSFGPAGSGATYVAGKHGLRIDFLTTRKRTSDPVNVPNLKIAMQPLSYMELLLEHPMQVTVLSRRGAVLVNVPDPTNLALHKLIVAVERGATWRSKSVKDLMQAAALIDVISTVTSDEVRDRWREARRRGPSWKKKLDAGRKALASAIKDFDIDTFLPV